MAVGCSMLINTLCRRAIILYTGILFLWCNSVILFDDRNLDNFTVADVFDFLSGPPVLLRALTLRRINTVFNTMIKNVPIWQIQ